MATTKTDNENKTAKAAKSQQEIARDKRIKKEIRKFKKLIIDMSKDEQTLPMIIIQELAFMIVTLEDLKVVVNRDGVVTKMQQGSYVIERENPALKSYNATIQRYNAAVKLLDDIVNKNGFSSENEKDIKRFMMKKT